MTTGPIKEVEVKLEAQPETLARIRRSKLVSQLAVGAPETATVETVYFDSADYRLAKKRIAFRIRRRGRHFEQSAKAETKANGAAPTRLEWRAEIEGLEPKPDLIADADIRKRVEKLKAKGELGERCRTKIRRTIRELKMPDGGLIELAFDTGEILLPDGQRTAEAISELELELKSGSPASLVSLARQLAEEFPLRLALKSRAERGLDLAEQAPNRAQKAGTIELEPGVSVSAGFAAILSHCLHHALENEGAILKARNPEGVHQMRVALRRLRSAMSAFGKALRTQEMKRLRDEAKALADVLGAARDLDVFSEQTLAPLKAARPRDAQLAVFARLVEKRRHDAWRAVGELLESPRYRLLMIDLAAAIACEAWRGDVADSETAAILSSELVDHARHVLAKRLAKVGALGEEIEALDAEGRHELRIELKKLRYAGEFFSSLFSPKAAQAYLRRIAELQEIFGYLNDASVAEQIVTSILSDNKGRDLPAVSWAGGLVVGWHTERVNESWIHAQKRWKSLDKARPFWLR